MRIYKGSEITLRLYNPCKIEDGLVDVVLYTTNPKLAYKIKDATVEGNIVYVKIDKSTFNNMEDGVINYIILDEVYNTERQSSYYLKTPDDYIAKSVQPSKNIDIVDNGDYKILPDEDYTSIEEVNVHVEFDAEPYIQRGFELGEENQKSKLESVSITENGTYTREDGYNEIHVEVPDLNGDYQTGYDEGYEAGIDYASENAGEIAAQTARVLNITENGTYTSEYSQWVDYPKPEQVTGVFDDGKEFYNEAYPQGIVYRTNDFIITPQTKIELWFKPVNYGWATNYFSLDVMNAGDEFRLGVYGNSSTKNSFQAKIGDSFVYIDLTELEYKKMHHIVMSFVDGFWLDGVKVGDFEGDFTIRNSFYSFKINPTAANVGGSSNYGMFKIDDVVIIPTEDGFLNVNTNELLTYTNLTTQPQYTYYNNFTEPVAEGNLIKTVNVDVQPKINVAETGLKFGNSTFTELPSWVDFEGITDASGMFYKCRNLQTLPLFDTSLCTSMNDTFAYCTKLKTLPPYITSNVTDMYQMCFEATGFETLPAFDASKVTNMNRYFKFYSSSADYYPNLTDVGGWINLNTNWSDNYGLITLKNLTYQSCINILNGLADVTELGSRTLKVHPNFLTTVGDEISIGVAKGWQIIA
jgi:hypothetical protein